MPRSRRQRSVIVLLLTAFLLFQQLAMSALACTAPLAATAVPAMSISMSTSAAMSPECRAAMAAEHPSAAADGSCKKYCAPDATSASTPSVPPVPPLALPPLLHALALTAPTQVCDYGSDGLFARSDPPTRLHYCRLLI